MRVSGDWLFYLDGQLIRQEKNLITQAGLNYLASLLINETTNNIPFHLALGTGTTAPTATDTKLVAEGLRKEVSAKTRQGSMVRLRTFFLANEANGTWREFGIFLAGTNAANSGTLLNRIVPTGGISKAANQVLTIEVRITFSAG
ncbi:MAG: hypothetical protein K6T66_06505 [Peptococcaceae bacterium]|nr:hypothetical protein [Peptococcaceae bacterium]